MIGLVKTLGSILVLGVLVILGISFYIEQTTAEHIYPNLQQVPQTETALLLNTSGYLEQNGSNTYLQQRLDATAELYNAGKVSRILAMGERVSSSQSDDPRNMKRRLQEKGVPADAILTSMEIDGAFQAVRTAQQRLSRERIPVTVASQPFHAKRVVRLARSLDMEAVGYGVSAPNVSYMEQAREQVARARNMWQLYWLKWIEEPNYFKYSPSS